MVRDARGSAVAALTWVLWKGRNRLQNLEATSRNFSGPTSFQLFGNIWRNACVQVHNNWNFGFFLEKFGLFKTALTHREYSYIAWARFLSFVGENLKTRKADKNQQPNQAGPSDNRDHGGNRSYERPVVDQITRGQRTENTRTCR